MSSSHVEFNEEDVFTFVCFDYKLTAGVRFDTDRAHILFNCVTLYVHFISGILNADRLRDGTRMVWINFGSLPEKNRWTRCLYIFCHHITIPLQRTTLGCLFFVWSAPTKCISDMDY